MLPAPFAPLPEVRPLLAEDGVVAVPGVEPRLVGQLVEHPRLQVTHQRPEVLRAGRLAGPAGNRVSHNRSTTRYPGPVPELAAVYCRISEDPRALEAGVTRQSQDCKQLVRDRGWQLVDTWTDNDVAVLKPGAARPEYDAMMAAAERGEVTRIVAYGLSRLWRNRIERAQAIDRLKQLRVSIALVKGSDLDLSSAAGRTYAGILGEFDTAESELKAERVAPPATGVGLTGRRPRSDRAVRPDALAR